MARCSSPCRPLFFVPSHLEHNSRSLPQIKQQDWYLEPFHHGFARHMMWPQPPPAASRHAFVTIAATQLAVSHRRSDDVALASAGCHSTIVQLQPPNHSGNLAALGDRECQLPSWFRLSIISMAGKSMYAMSLGQILGWATTDPAHLRLISWTWPAP